MGFKVLIVGEPELRAALMEQIKLETVEYREPAVSMVIHAHTPESFDKLAVANIVHDITCGPRSGVRPMVLLSGFSDEDYVENGAVIEFIHQFIVEHHTTIEDVAAQVNMFYVEPPPFNPYYIECLIQRDGPTEMYLDGTRYLFEKNEVGHYVCLVQRDDHRKYLRSLGTFRIYQEDKIPPPEFTEDETDFMREWKTMDKDSLRSYVNGRIDRFLKARDRVKRIAIRKWEALHSRDKQPVPCPISIKAVDAQQAPAQDAPAAQGAPPVEPLDESTKWTDEQFNDWVNTWLRLNAERFVTFVQANEDKFLNAPDEVWDKAKEKWEKLVPGKIWPFTIEEDV